MGPVKVLFDEAAGRADIVDARHGEKLSDGYTYAPHPVARLTTSFGRKWPEVKADAEAIAAFLNARP